MSEAGSPGQSESGVAAGFGRYLRAQRQLADLSLRQLSELARISNPYLSQIERGLHQPSVAVIRSLAEALELSAGELLAHAAGLADHPKSEHSTEGAIRNDPHLDESQKSALLAVYRSMIDHGEQESADRGGAQKESTRARPR